MAWQIPKIDWTPSNNIHDEDLNRIEGNTKDNHDRLNQIDPNRDGKVTSAERADNADSADFVGGLPASEVAKCKTGSYYGDGLRNRIINIGFIPKLLIIGGRFRLPIASGGYTVRVGDWVVVGSINDQMSLAHRDHGILLEPYVVLVENGFRVGIDPYGYHANSSGHRYVWTAIG